MTRRTRAQLENRLADVRARLNLPESGEGSVHLDAIGSAYGGGYRLIVQVGRSGIDTSTFGNISLSASAMYDALELILYATSFAAKRT